MAVARSSSGGVAIRYVLPVFTDDVIYVFHSVRFAVSYGLLANKKGSQYSITERRVPELIPVLCSQPAGDVSHKPGSTLATLEMAATSFAAW